MSLVKRLHKSVKSHDKRQKDNFKGGSYHV